MNTKTLTKEALDVIDQYMAFKITPGASGPTGQEVSVNVPYYNNKRIGLKGALRAETGKGSPREVYEEVLIKGKTNNLTPASFTSGSLREFMIREGIGIDCSGLVYHVLNAESISRKIGTIDKRLHFPLAGNIFRRLRAKMRPVENTDVATLASDKNSHVIPTKEIQPGDFISMIGTSSDTRDHIVVVHQIEYQNFLPATVHYTHSVAYPEDGEYGHGVRQGKIDILDPGKPILEAVWNEKPLLDRAKRSTTEIRRLNQF